MYQPSSADRSCDSSDAKRKTTKISKSSSTWEEEKTVKSETSNTFAFYTNDCDSLLLHHMEALNNRYRP